MVSRDPNPAERAVHPLVPQAADSGSPVSPPNGLGLTVARAPGALWRRSLDCVLVLGSEGPEPVRLEGAATTVWDYLEAPATLGDLLSDLAGHFGISPERLRGDLEPTLERLVIVGGLRVV